MGDNWILYYDYAYSDTAPSIYARLVASCAIIHTHISILNDLYGIFVLCLKCCRLTLVPYAILCGFDALSSLCIRRVCAFTTECWKCMSILIYTLWQWKWYLSPITITKKTIIIILIIRGFIKALLLHVYMYCLIFCLYYVQYYNMLWLVISNNIAY